MYQQGPRGFRTEHSLKTAQFRSKLMQNMSQCKTRALPLRFLLNHRSTFLQSNNIYTVLIKYHMKLSLFQLLFTHTENPLKALLFCQWTAE